MRKLVGLVAAFGLLAVACSSDDDGGGASTEAPTETEAPSTDAPPATDDAAPSTDAPPSTDDAVPSTDEVPSGEVTVGGQGIDDDRILIGMSIDQSGVAAPISVDIIKALQARLDVANDAGGIAGRDIELIVLDDKADPTQALANFRQLWEQDKVFAIYTLGGNVPLEYIGENEVPTFTLAGPPEVYASTYPTIIPLGSLLPTWAAQTAYSVVEYGGVEPKTVAVLYDPEMEALNPFIEEYWTALGVEEVIFDPPPDDCSALVLKYKDAGVDYWDFQDFSYIGCMAAEENLGWKPPMGQGGAIASTLAIVRLVGEPMFGNIGGSPNRLADGRPTFDTPNEAHQLYLDGMEKYAPEVFADEGALNGGMTMLAWVAGNFIVEATEGAGIDSGEVSQETVLEWSWAIEDWDTGIAGVIHSARPDCKTGNDQTIWGYWLPDPDPEGDFVLEPFVPDLVDNSWLGVDECYLTALAESISS